MENKINIAELLKDCPMGMELDCTMYDNVKLFRVSTASDYPITIVTENGFSTKLTKYGQNVALKEAKCVIFPKGKTTWEGFHRPFKDGDIVVTGNKYKCAAIFKNTKSFYDSEGFNYYALISLYTEEPIFKTEDWIDGVNIRSATKEEKQKLFDTIKNNGYKWNAEIKTLEKLSKFKVGDYVVKKGGITVPVLITGVSDEYYYSNTKNSVGYFRVSEQDDWELVSKKFDITTLKPFDKVLVRTNVFTPCWTTAFFDGYQPNIGGSFTPFGVTGGKYFQQCIPYEGNEHLRATTKDCDDYYKTWE